MKKAKNRFKASNLKRKEIHSKEVMEALVNPSQKVMNIAKARMRAERTK
jgi:hypothetical protein